MRHLSRRDIYDRAIREVEAARTLQIQPPSVKQNPAGHLSWTFLAGRQLAQPTHRQQHLDTYQTLRLDASCMPSSLGTPFESPFSQSDPGFSFRCQSGQSAQLTCSSECSCRLSTFWAALISLRFMLTFASSLDQISSMSVPHQHAIAVRPLGFEILALSDRPLCRRCSSRWSWTAWSRTW